MNLLTKLLQRGTSDTELSSQGTAQGETLVAAGSSDYEEITRQGFAYHVNSTTPTASVVAIPTTTAGIAFWNSAADGGKSAVIDAIYAINIVAHSTLGQAGLIYVVGQTRVAALTNAFVVRKNNGNGPAVGNVLLAATGGAVLDSVTGVAIGWMPVGQAVNNSVVSLPGNVIFAPVDGRIIVPPGRQFGINVMASNTQFTWVIGVMWHEKVLSLG
uniref:Uncharacterized protein n=1 Tax=viral metagenome TaxID=1070528 RepID=A0A6M3Y1J8_9ZZZZ